MATIVTPTRAPSAPSGRMVLSNVRSSLVRNAPKRTVLVGLEGVGKSSFAAAAPSPIFLCPEDGIPHLDVPKFPEPQSWEDVLDAIDVLTREQHPHRTFVADTLDWLEPLNHGKVCRSANKADIEAFGYGKGYVAALDEWRIFLSRLEGLRRAKGMDIILLAHSWIKPYKNPMGDDYDRFEMKIHNKAAGLIKEWADAVLFAMYDEATRETENGRVKGISSGARIIRTQRTAAWDAKNRYNLPERLPLDYEDFSRAVTAGAPKDPDALRADIAATLEKLADPTITEQATALVAKVGNNAADLAKLANRLQAKLPTPTNS